MLPFIPLMQGGGESGIIAKWLDLAGAEPDARRRGDYGGLALVFAEAAGCSDAWKIALKEWNVIQSKQVAEWQDQARQQGMELGRQQGETQGAANLLLCFLSTKFGELPEPVVKAVQSVGKTEQLNTLLIRAMQSASIEAWRQGSPELPNGAPH